jgi:hypothetical protein
MEHSWTQPGAVGERAGLVSLRRLDARVRDRVK